MSEDLAVKARDFTKPWYHGSPLRLQTLREGSTITQEKDLSRIFSHKPSIVSVDDEGAYSHNGTELGFLYQIAETVTADDVEPHPETTLLEGQEWLIKRSLKLRLVEETNLNPDELLSKEEIELLQKYT